MSGNRVAKCQKLNMERSSQPTKITKGTTDTGIEYFNWIEYFYSFNNICSNFRFNLTQNVANIWRGETIFGTICPEKTDVHTKHPRCKVSIFKKQSQLTSTSLEILVKTQPRLVYAWQNTCTHLTTITTGCVKCVKFYKQFLSWDNFFYNLWQIL